MLTLPTQRKICVGFLAASMDLHSRAVTEWNSLWFALFKLLDRFKSVPYPYPISGPEHRPDTLDELMFAECYVWDTQTMFWDSKPTAPLTARTAWRLLAV